MAGLTLLLAGMAAPAAAQRGNSTTEVRSELASVLLQSRRYDEAAREYRAIVARQPNNFAARLGLARALAWGKRPREAELELRTLRGMRPRDRDVESLLASVRESLQPDAHEAATWWAERPSYTPYRRILARALMREGRPREAVAHYTRVLERAPGDTAVKHELALALANDKQLEAAHVQYDALIAAYPTASLLLERGQLNMARRDYAAAEADALASLRMRRSAEAYLLLGELRRWRGDYAEARIAFDYARMMRPHDPDVSSAAAQLERDVRPVIAFVPMSRQDGWHARSSTMTDNLGVAYVTAGARLERALGRGTSGFFDMEWRRLTEQTADVDAMNIAAAFHAGIAREFVSDGFVGRLSGRGGLVRNSDTPLLTAAAGAAGWFGAWGVALEYARVPALPTLLTTDASELSETTASGAVGGPLGLADVALRIQHARISDGNARSDIQLAFRYPLNANLAAIATGSGIWFSDESSDYWSPSSYKAGAGGLEVSSRNARGFSFAINALAGPARSVEDTLTSTSIQLSGGAYLSYRTGAQEVGATVSYGGGRAGDYRRFEANIFVSLLR